MRNLILHRRVIVLMLATVLLVFGIQDIGYSQFPVLEEGTSTIGPKLSVDQIYDKTIRSLVWNVHTSYPQLTNLRADLRIRR